jgi:hypothetical protein
MSWTEMFRHLQEEPRWNADRRACSAEHAAASVRCGGKDTRLSAFRFPFFFHCVAGLSGAKPGSDIEASRVVAGFHFNPAMAFPLARTSAGEKVRSLALAPAVL